MWKAFSKANATLIPTWIIPERGSSSGAPDVFRVLSYSEQQIDHTVKQMCARGQRTDQIIARALLHPLIFKKWPWSRSKILETEGKKSTANAPAVPVLWKEDSSVIAVISEAVRNAEKPHL